MGQVHDYASAHAVDPARTWLLGWSGGASYIGRRSQELEPTFKAFVLHGGGKPPLAPGCSSTLAPVYFLVGDKNPLHHLAVQLRDYYQGCGHDVTWTLVPGADHAGEWAALTPQAIERILDWLLDHARLDAAAPAREDLTGAPQPSADGSTPIDAAMQVPAPTGPLASRPRVGSCAIAPGKAIGVPSTVALVVLALLYAARRRTSPVALTALLIFLVTSAIACGRSSSHAVVPSELVVPSRDADAQTSLEVDAGGPPRSLGCIARYYTGQPLFRDGAWWLELPNGSTLPYDDGRTKDFAQRLADPDIKDIFAVRYAVGPLRAVDTPEEDPGRFRIEALLRATYGSTPRDVEAALVTVPFDGRTIRVHAKIRGPTERVGVRLERLAKADPTIEPFLHRLGGTFAWRPIAGTDRTSAHAWGIAIDINPDESNYWRNQSDAGWRNHVPPSIVDAFEAEGFIWGGRWFHFDTMHFEYRPELLDPDCYP